MATPRHRGRFRRPEEDARPERWKDDRHVNASRIPCLPVLRAVGLLGTVAAACVLSPACLSAPPVASATPVAPRGCLPDGGSPSPTAPGGYYTSGGTVCTALGAPHLFHGVDRPSLEWNPQGEYLSDGDFALMASWGANVVRIALNQDFWLSSAVLYDSYYATTVQAAVTSAEKAGMDVILDLHWSDQGDLSVSSTAQQGAGYSNQQPMADANSVEFWREIATLYKGDGHVLFELYNEPHGISWDVWLHGGNAGGFTAVGMQDLYDAIRGTGANNVVIAGGNSWAYDLSSVGASGVHVDGYNVMYATHPYERSSSPSGWESTFGHLETSDFAPVIATEFGDTTVPTCTGAWDHALIQFADANAMSWTAWGWYVTDPPGDPQGCGFPSLILDWLDATPTLQGAAVKAALSAYPPSPGGVDAGSPGGPEAGGSDGPAAVTVDAADEPSSASGASGDDATVDAPDAGAVGVPDAGNEASSDAADGGSDDAPSDAGVAPSE